MATESKKPVSELTVNEAYLRFIACETPEDPDYSPTYLRLEKLLYGPAAGYASGKLGGRSNNKHKQDLVDDTVQNAFLKIIRHQRKDTNRRTGNPLRPWTPQGPAESHARKFTAWFKLVIMTELDTEFRRNRPQVMDDQNEGTSLLEETSVAGSEISLSPERDMWGVVVNTAIATEEAEALKDCRDKLDEESRGVIDRMFHEGQNLREIAEHFGWINEQTGRPRTEQVDRLLKRAKLQLAECMGGKGHE